MPTESELLEVAANGAMPSYVVRQFSGWYHEDAMKQRWGIPDEVVTDLACIGMARRLKKVGVNVFDSLDFHNLLAWCRLRDDWRTDAGGGA